MFTLFLSECALGSLDCLNHFQITDHTRSALLTLYSDFLSKGEGKIHLNETIVKKPPITGDNKKGRRRYVFVTVIKIIPFGCVLYIYLPSGAQCAIFRKKHGMELNKHKMMIDRFANCNPQNFQLEICFMFGYGYLVLWERKCTP